MLGVVGPARAFLAPRAAGKCLGRQGNAVTSASRVPAAALSRGLGVPGSLHERSADREGAVRRLLHQVGCRILVLDELHNYDTFLRHGLGRTGPGARNLDRTSDAELVRLSAGIRTGTGVPVERLQGMRTGATIARVNERIQGWLLTEDGRAALDQLLVSLMCMTRQAEADSRARERHNEI